MSVIGYARVSTGHQLIEAQVDALTGAGCERIFSDKLSGAREDRPGLTQLLDYARPGDTVEFVNLTRPHRDGLKWPHLVAVGVFMRGLGGRGCGRVGRTWCRSR